MPVALPSWHSCPVCFPFPLSFFIQSFVIPLSFFPSHCCSATTIQSYFLSILSTCPVQSRSIFSIRPLHWSYSHLLLQHCDYHIIITILCLLQCFTSASLISVVSISPIPSFSTLCSSIGFIWPSPTNTFSDSSTHLWSGASFLFHISPFLFSCNLLLLLVSDFHGSFAQFSGSSYSSQLFCFTCYLFWPDSCPLLVKTCLLPSCIFPTNLWQESWHWVLSRQGAEENICQLGGHCMCFLRQFMIIKLIKVRICDQSV